MHYVDAIAEKVRDLADPEQSGYGGLPLYRLYALLVLTTGVTTTKEHVHEAWSIWALDHRSHSLCLIPFSDLSQEMQEQDQPFVDAIQAVARDLRSGAWQF